MCVVQTSLFRETLFVSREVRILICVWPLRALELKLSCFLQFVAAIRCVLAVLSLGSTFVRWPIVATLVRESWRSRTARAPSRQRGLASHFVAQNL